MREVDRMAELLERVIDGDPWHGPSVAVLLEGLTAAQAATHAVAGAHSIWEVVVHMTGWAREVHRRLEGASAGEPAGGDWPPVDAVSPSAWRDAVAALVASHRGLAAAIRSAGDGVLETPVVDTRDPAAGLGLSKYLTLHGLVHHTAYHAGQIALLRRTIAAGAS